MNGHTPDPQFILAVSRFIQAFETVFEDDWHHTKSCIQDDFFIPDTGTFITPGVPSEQEHSDWANRGGILNAYRDVAKRLKEHGWHPDQCDSNIQDLL